MFYYFFLTEQANNLGNSLYTHNDFISICFSIKSSDKLKELSLRAFIIYRYTLVLYLHCFNNIQTCSLFILIDCSLYCLHKFIKNNNIVLFCFDSLEIWVKFPEHQSYLFSLYSKSAPVGSVSLIPGWCGIIWRKSGFTRWDRLAIVDRERIWREKY